MFTHEEVWRGIDRLARHHGLSPSGLARRAGLDATPRRGMHGDDPPWHRRDEVDRAATVVASGLSGRSVDVRRWREGDRHAPPVDIDMHDVPDPDRLDPVVP